MQVRCPFCYSASDVCEFEVAGSVECGSCGSSFDVAPPTRSYWLTRRTIGHFEILDQLGSGAFGTVWKARDTRLDRLVAIKVPRIDLLGGGHEEMFYREARAAAQLHHPNIVAVHEIGREDDTPFIVCDFVEGITLADRLTAGPIAVPEAADLVARISLALEHAHRSGVIHRDLKPQNIMLDQMGNPLLMDFGLAKREVGEVTMTVDGRILGTAAYMSPEQARGDGHHVDCRTDIYSLGVILFELLTGERPFRGNVRMLLHQVINEDPPSPRSLNNRIPRDLETICLTCLEKLPDRRYAKAAELAEDLRRFLASEPILARPVTTFERIWRWYRKTSFAAMVIAGALTVANSLVFVAWGLTGVVILAVGGHSHLNRWRAICELTAWIALFYVPWMLVGVRTLNGDRRALWIGAIFSLLSFFGMVLMMLGLSPVLQLEIMTDVRTNPFFRLQLSSLLACIAAALFGAYLFAIASTFRGAQNSPLSTSAMETAGLRASPRVTADQDSTLRTKKTKQ